MGDVLTMRRGVPDPSWKSGPPDPDHYCGEHLRPVENEEDALWAEEFVLFELWECTLCDATAKAFYDADPEQIDYCDECGEAHHLGSITDVVSVDEKSVIIVEQECVECGGTVEVEYEFDYREMPYI